MKNYAILLLILAFPALAEVEQATTITKYVGLSSDTKPTQGVKAGDEFLETDTMDVFVCISSDNNVCSGWTDKQVVIALQAGEDQTNNVMRVEGQFSYCVDDADIVCKATPGLLHSVSCWPEDAAATAGRVQIRDATAAGGGTVVWQDEFAAAEHTPSGWTPDIVMAAGIVIDFDTTADVFCTVSYR